MKRKCAEAEREIAAAAGAELPQAVMEHIGQCEVCARFHADTLSLATHRDRPALSPEAAVDMARIALRQERPRKSMLWLIPLLSASACAAALILYFGLAPVPSPGETTGIEDETAATVTDSFIPALSEFHQTALPDPLQAATELFIAESNQEDDS